MPTVTLQRLVEESDLGPNAVFGTTDADAFLLKNVRILGVHSKNKQGKRKYLIEALQKAIPFFDGQGVNKNHDYSILDTGRPRPYTDRIGVLQSVKCDAEGLIGDLQLNPHMPLAGAIRWDYVHGTKKVGLSFLGEGDGLATDPNTIKEITKVFSIDLVQDPATSQSLREAEEQEDKPRMGLSEMHDMLGDHEQRLGECETKLSEAVEGKKALEESLAKVVDANKQLLAEVKLLKDPSAKEPHLHPHTTTTPPADDFVKSLTRPTRWSGK